MFALVERGTDRMFHMTNANADDVRTILLNNADKAKLVLQRQRDPA